MKETLLVLPLTSNSFIEHYFPDKYNKYNYAHDAADFIEGCDQVVVGYNQNQEYIIYKDMISDSLWLTDAIPKIDSNQLELPGSLEVGMMAYAFNKDSHEESEGMYKDVNFSNFWLWSTPRSYQTFMYTHQGEVYLEIGSIYPWLYHDPEPEAPSYVTYEVFMNKYSPLLVTTLSTATLNEWYEKSKRLFNQIR